MKSLKHRIPTLTNEEKERLKKKRLENRASWTLAYQLGVYVGEQIVSRYLPTLSVDSIHTKKNISVTCAEGDECRRLNEVWFQKTMQHRDDNSKSAEEWNALRECHKKLEDKYLPLTVECHFTLLNVSEEHMADFKEGISICLWDCDCSHYSTKVEDINVVTDDDGYFTTITLKKD